MNKIKIIQIGQYPPPHTGWSVRIKLLKEALVARGHECQVLNLGQNRAINSPEYIDVQSGLDYMKKLIRLKYLGYQFHIHTNAQAVKGPLLALTAHIISLCFGSRAAVTFHGGHQQKYFPRARAGKKYPLIYLNLLLARIIVCNDQHVKKDIVSYGKGISPQKVYPIPAFSIQYIEDMSSDLPQELSFYIRSKHKLIVSYIAFRNGFDLQALTSVLKDLPHDIGVVITGGNKIEDKEIENCAHTLQNMAQEGRIFHADNLEHGTFLTLLKSADLYVRTHEGDGVSSSVLEALSLGTSVLAVENGRRPQEVLTYQPGDSQDLQDKILKSLNNIRSESGRAEDFKPRDTLSEETELLIRSYGA